MSDSVASYIYRKLSAEELMVNFALDLGQVFAALASYYRHTTEIDQQMRDAEVKADHLLADLDSQRG